MALLRQCLEALRAREHETPEMYVSTAAVQPCSRHGGAPEGNESSRASKVAPLNRATARTATLVVDMQTA